MQWKNASLKYESQTDRLILKVLTPNYANAVLNFQNRNRESFEAYEPTRPANFYTASYQQAVLKCEWDLALKQQCIRFYVFRKDDPQMIIGTVCLHDIRFAAAASLFISAANSSTLPEIDSAIAIAASLPLRSIIPYKRSSMRITSPA